jgi:hypothetical protein
MNWQEEHVIRAIDSHRSRPGRAARDYRANYDAPAPVPEDDGYAWVDDDAWRRRCFRMKAINQYRLGINPACRVRVGH